MREASSITKNTREWNLKLELEYIKVRSRRVLLILCNCSPACVFVFVFVFAFVLLLNCRLLPFVNTVLTILRASLSINP